MILINGKRIDGCTDTLPIGTVQPFLGLTPPLGYLVCQGQLISKVEYPELYNICKSTFGTETETHFYLPDLRGKTIAGYDNNDSTMNTIGKLLGEKTHTHTSAAHTHTIGAHTHSTGNHTLTVAEMPSHRHDWSRLFNADSSGGSWVGDSQFSVAAKRNIASTNFPDVVSSNQMEYHMNSVGGSGAHNHGNTGSTALTSNSTTPGSTGSNSNFQPTITMNWIVKAVMLIPEYFKVDNTLTSTSTSNALSAAQGKILNDKIDMMLPFPESRTTWTWGVAKAENGYVPLIEWMEKSGASMAFATKDTQLSVQIDGLYYQNEGKSRVLDVRDLATSYAFYKWPSKISISTSGTTTVSKELTITTKKGNPVFIIVTGDNNPMSEGVKNWFNINFYRNGTLLSHQIVESHELSHNIPFAMQYLDAVATGTYTYKVEFKIGNGSADLGENGAHQTPNFTVFEI